MRRISIVGASGAGKSTLARRLAATLGLPHVELDAIHHQAGWASLPRDEFRARVADLVATEAWIVDGNYRAVRDLVWARADTVVWLDLPRPLAVRRVARRTLRRVVTRQELWNGNREPWSNLYRLDPEQNPVRWAWAKQPLLVQQYEAAMRHDANAHLRFVRLRTPADVAAFGA